MPADPTPAVTAPKKVTTKRLAARFDADDQGHYRVSAQGDEITRSEIVNARVRIVSAYADDAGEPYPLAETETADRSPSVVTHYDLRVSRAGTKPVVLPDVAVDDLAKGVWVDRAELSGLPVLTASGPTARQDIVTAIKSSSPYEIVPAYGRLGWHYRGGRWMYVHGGGAWDADGAVAGVRVHGDGLGVFTMAPPPATQEDGTRAFDALFRLFTMGPDRAAAVEIGAAFRASMGRPVGSITYLAVNQSGKSGRAAFITQCWAPSVRWRRLPFSAGKENGSPTYIEHVHHTYGDMIVVWDDMAPVGTAMERAMYFDRFARSLFNGTSRGRGKREGGARARLRPRAFGVLTAEDISAVESGQNRTHVLSMERGDFDPAAFGRADEGTGPTDRSALMAAFIIWWAGQMPAHSQVADHERDMAAELASATGAPSRYIESVADKAAGLATGLRFALTMGWVTQARSDELWARAWDGLVDSLRRQVSAMTGQSMHERIRDTLLDGLASHEAHVLGMDGRMPQQDHVMLGWDAEGRAMGRMIGWTDTDRLYLIPSAAGAFVSAHTGRAGSPIEITPRAMGEALRVAGLIPGSTQRGRGGRTETLSTIPKKVLGKKQSVWALRWSPDTEETGDAEEAAPPTAPTGPPIDPPTEVPAEGPIAGSPCAGCGEPSTWQRGGVPLHAACEAPAPVRVLAPAPAMLPTPAPPVHQESTPLAVAADSEGLYLPGGEVLAAPAGDMAAFLSRMAGLMPGGGSVAITAELAARLGYPAAPTKTTFAAADRAKKSKAKAGAPVESRAAVDGRAGGWLTADSGIQAWTTWRHPATTTRVHVVVIEWSGAAGSSHVLIEPTLTAPEAGERLAEWHALTGTPYVMTAGITGCNLLVGKRHFGREALRKWDPPTDCPASSGGVERGYDYVRPVEEWTDAERAETTITGWDMHKAYLSAFGGAYLAMDRLEHVGMGGFDATRAGYWLIAREHRPYPMLPDLRGKRVLDKPGPMWVSTPTAELLLKEGMPEEAITDAWLSPRATGHSARIGRDMADTVRDALRQLEEQGEEGPLRAALKACYRETYGQIQRATGSVHRTDWADTIIGYCRAALTRTVIRIGRDTGRWPVAMDVDCAYYAGETNPGFPLLGETPGKYLGTYTLKSTQSVTDYLGEGQ